MSNKISQGDEAKISLPQVSSRKDSAESADRRIMHPLLDQLLTTWTCMILDYNGTANRMRDAGRPHDVQRYEAKMETLAWCSRELTAIAKQLPLAATQDTKSAVSAAPSIDTGASSSPHLTERDRIKQAIKNLHDQVYGVGHKSSLLNLDDVLGVIDDEEKGV